MRIGVIALCLLLASCSAIDRTTENLETTTKHLETTTEKFPEMVDQTKATLAELQEVGVTIREEIPRLGENITTLRKEVVESLDNLDANIVRVVTKVEDKLDSVDTHIAEFKIAVIGDETEDNKGLAHTQKRLNRLGSVLMWIAIVLAIPLFILIAVVIHHKWTTKKRHAQLSSKNENA